MYNSCIFRRVTFINRRVSERNYRMYMNEEKEREIERETEKKRDSKKEDSIRKLEFHTLRRIIDVNS